MSSAQLYDTIGATYTVTRRTEPRIAARVWAALGDARTVLDVGAGTGSYEPPGGACAERGLGTRGLADCRAHSKRDTPGPRSERMMKAVRFSQFGGPEVLEIVDLPDPHPGPGQIRIAVHAAGVNPSDWKKRKGLMDGELPQTMGHEAAGVVDELGEGVADVAVGDRVFGFSAEGAAQAELAVLSCYAPIPPSLDFPGAAALPAAIETATRALDQLGVGSGSTLLINGASGSVGSAASTPSGASARTRSTRPSPGRGPGPRSRSAAASRPNTSAA